MTPKILPTIPPEMHSRFSVIFFFQEFIQNASANASRISSVGSFMIPLEILWGLLQDFAECSLRNFSYRDAFENFSWNFPEIRSMKSSKDLSKNFSRDIFGDSSKNLFEYASRKISPRCDLSSNIFAYSYNNSVRDFCENSSRYLNWKFTREFIQKFLQQYT